MPDDEADHAMNVVSYLKQDCGSATSMLCAGPIEAGVSVVLDQPAMMFPTLIMNRSARSFVTRLLEYEVLRERMEMLSTKRVSKWLFPIQ